MIAEGVVCALYIWATIIFINITWIAVCETGTLYSYLRAKFLRWCKSRKPKDVSKDTPKDIPWVHGFGVQLGKTETMMNIMNYRLQPQLRRCALAKRRWQQ